MLPALIAGQIALHAAMAGQRMAAPLQALQDGHSAWAVGVLLALFAALPVLTAIGSGRMADRHGYHRPLRIAVICTVVGASLALLACFVPAWWRFGLLCLGAAASGVGTNVGLIVIQRTAGHLAADSTERLRVFSWLGMAPSLANVVGPVAAGLPLLAEENVVDSVRVDRMLVRGGRDVFGLRVQGDSMIEAGILNGDYIFVRKQATAERGEIVVALVADEATVKYYFPEKDYIRFQPANAQMAPILVRASDFKPTMLLGVVVGVYRRL